MRHLPRPRRFHQRLQRRLEQHQGAVKPLHAEGPNRTARFGPFCCLGINESYNAPGRLCEDAFHTANLRHALRNGFLIRQSPVGSYAAATAHSSQWSRRVAAGAASWRSLVHWASAPLHRPQAGRLDSAPFKRGRLGVVNSSGFPYPDGNRERTDQKAPL